MKLPCCDYEIEVHTLIGPEGHNDIPNPGDFAVCLNCGAWLRYTDDSMRLFEADDLEDVPDKQLSRLREVTRVIRERGRIE